MTGIDAAQWLQTWVQENLNALGYVERKSDMKDEAVTCAHDALSAGLSIAELKEAANGDLESYLVRRQNELTDAGMEPLPASRLTERRRGS